MTEEKNMNTLEKRFDGYIYALIKNIFPLLIYAIGNIGITWFVITFLDSGSYKTNLVYSTVMSLFFSAPFFLYYSKKVGKMEIPGSYDLEFYDAVKKKWRALDFRGRAFFVLGVFIIISTCIGVCGIPLLIDKSAYPIFGAIIAIKVIVTDAVSIFVHTIDG